MVLVGMTLAVPALATEAAPRPLTQAAAAKVAALPLAALAQTTPGTAVTAAEADRPFLRTVKGKIAVALLAGAIGYTFYSFGHDRVQSPVK